MQTKSPRFSTYSVLLGLLTLVAAFGCAPRADGADESTENAGTPAASAAEVAGWRETVSRLHAEVAELSQQPSASNEMAKLRLRELTDDLARLERRIAAYAPPVDSAATPSSPNKTEAGKIVVDDPATALATPR